MAITQLETSTKLRMCGAERSRAVCYSQGSLTSQVVMSRKLLVSAQNSVTAVGSGVVRPPWAAESIGRQNWRRNEYFEYKFRFSVLFKFK
jgi:hypothetical protein